LVTMSQNIKNLKEQHASSSHLFLTYLHASRHANGWTSILSVEDRASKTGSLLGMWNPSHTYFSVTTQKLTLYLTHYAHGKLVFNLNRTEKHTPNLLIKKQNVTGNQPNYALHTLECWRYTTWSAIIHKMSLTSICFLLPTFFPQP
jgi:hypothetical protein